MTRGDSGILDDGLYTLFRSCSAQEAAGPPGEEVFNPRKTVAMDKGVAGDEKAESGH